MKRVGHEGVHVNYLLREGGIVFVVSEGVQTGESMLGFACGRDGAPSGAQLFVLKQGALS